MDSPNMRSVVEGKTSNSRMLTYLLFCIGTTFAYLPALAQTQNVFSPTLCCRICIYPAAG